MKQTTNSIVVRIEWCRRQSAQARTELEADGWRAEEDGLRDALVNSDHTDDYRLYPPEICERYVRGFQDGTAWLRAAQAERMVHGAAVGTSEPALRTRKDVRLGDDQ